MNRNYFNAEHYPDPTAFFAVRNIELERLKDRNGSAFRPLVYICSSYAGDVWQNTENAARYCRFAVCRNVIPIAPHLLFPQFLNDGDEDERRLGLFMGLVLLSKCREAWVFGHRISDGMRAEIAAAGKRNLPVRYFDKNCREVKAN